MVSGFVPIIYAHGSGDCHLFEHMMVQGAFGIFANSLRKAVHR